MSKIKGLLLSFSLLFVFGLSYAQQVPNFKGTDINGVQHNLYESLNEGKVVIVEVFATWCHTCWSLHKKDFLENIYRTYGPSGTNQLEIFFIEGDFKTPAEGLYGEDSFGDWTEGVSYPVFNPNEFNQDFIDAFASDGVPTSNVICPINKEIIADIYQNDLDEIIEILQDCNTIYNVNDLQVLKSENDEIAVCKTTELLFEVLNSGTETINSFVLEGKYDDGTIFNTHSCEIEIKSGEVLEVSLGEYDLLEEFESQLVVVGISTEDKVPGNNEIEVTFDHAREIEQELNLYIKSDPYSKIDSTRWWIENSNGEKVVPETFIFPYVLVDVKINLEINDCYTFIIEEEYGDGMIFGDVELTTSAGEVLFDNADFRYRGEVHFEYVGSVTSNQDALPSNLYDLAIIPNIVDNNLFVNYKVPSEEKLELAIYSLQGNVLDVISINPTNGNGKHFFNVNSYATGVYFLRMQTNAGILTKKFTKI